MSMIHRFNGLLAVQAIIFAAGLSACASNADSDDSTTNDTGHQLVAQGTRVTEPGPDGTRVTATPDDREAVISPDDREAVISPDDREAAIPQDREAVVH